MNRRSKTTYRNLGIVLLVLFVAEISAMILVQSNPVWAQGVAGPEQAPGEFGTGRPGETRPTAPLDPNPEAATPEAQAQAAEALRVNTPSQATDPTDTKYKGCGWLSWSFACPIYWILDTLSDLLTTFFVSLASTIFDAFVGLAMIDLGATTFVRLGHSITLGVANMFFVLVLLWIAIATAFDYEEYHAKNLLPKLIIAALLINFSLAIGNSFIKLSNAIAHIFYAQLQQAPSAEEQRALGSPGSSLATPIASRVMLMSKFVAVKTTTPKEDAERERLKRLVREGNCQYLTAGEAGAGGEAFGGGAMQTVSCNTPVAQAAWDELIKKPDNVEGSLAGAFTSVFWKIVITPVLVFVLLAGALFILIRQLSLAIVLILGPIVFLFMILPKTQTYFNEWWDKLFKWSFFLPAYMFFLFLALKTGQSLLPASLTNSADKLPVFAQYMLTMGLLLGSLIIADKLGIKAAGAANKLGKGVAGAAGKFTGDRVWKGAGKATDALMGTKFGQGLAKMPLVRGIVRPAAAAVMKKGSAVEAKDASFYTKLPNARLSSILTTMGERQRQAVIGWLPASRQRQFNADGTLRTAPTAAAGQQTRNQAVQNQVMPVVDQATRNMPEEVRAAVRSGVEEAIQSQPLDANPEAIARAITDAAVVSASGVQSALRDQDVRFAFESGNTPSQMRGAITRGQRQAAAAPPQTSNDWEERVERLEAQAAEQTERRQT